jgi:serine phosphatase RsbU (regulator of sigma subunit)
MRPKFSSIKNKLIASFCFIAGIITVMILTFLFYNYRTHQLAELENKLVQMEKAVKDIEKLQLQFIMEESVNAVFHEANISKIGKTLNEKLNEVTQLAAEIQKEASQQYPDAEDHFATLEIKVSKLKADFQELSKTMLDRGYKDWGAEGEMREAIHRLEEAGPDLDRARYGELRRREKDYIIRKEPQYVTKVISLLADYRKYIKNNQSSISNPNRMLNNLDVYESNFNNIVFLDSKIGKSQAYGLRRQLALSQESLEREIANIRTIFDHITWKVNLHMRWIMLGLGLVLAILFIATVVILTQSLSKPIQKLSDSIREVVNNDFEEGEIYQVDKKDEIAMLSKDVTHMLQRMRERSVEIVAKNKEIGKQKSELAAINLKLEEKVQKRTEKIEKQKTELERVSNRVSASINYASRIQQAILPNPQLLQAWYPESFLLYKPKQVLSGDFLWFKKMGKYQIIAVCDCTGHGVPGALMSIISSELLDRIITTEKIIRPDEVLDNLRTKIRQALKTSEGASSDGLDGAIVVHDTEKNRLYYAGAKSPMIYVQNDKFNLIEGDRQTIGGRSNHKDKPFTLHIIDLKGTTQFYLGSDGYQDQFGGDSLQSRVKKFGRKQLRELIERIHNEPPIEQKAILKEELANWRNAAGHNNLEQTDDIMIFGASINADNYKPSKQLGKASDFNTNTKIKV